jgi:hypothetical protein
MSPPRSCFSSKGGSRTGIADAEQIFALGKSQLLAELYGTAYSERLGISSMYIRYHFGTSNDSNVNADNNGSKSVFGRLALTYTDQTVGVFGIYSSNTLDRTRQDGFPGLRNSVLRFGPDDRLLSCQADDPNAYARARLPL